MKKLTDAYNIIVPAKAGELLEGAVLSRQGSGLFVDLGPLGSGAVRGREFQEAKSKIKELKPGDKITVKVIDPDGTDGYIELSLKEAQQEAVWEKLNQESAAGETVKVKILGANKGGLLCKLEGVNAFLPVSQLTSEHYPKVQEGDPQKIFQALQKFIGQELEVQILSLDQKKQQIILSERLKEAAQKKEKLKQFKEGDVVEGRISAICDFGAFVQFAADAQLEGLIHISELDWQLVENPAEAVKIGQAVKVKILQIQDEKVFLSLKALQPNPWEGIEQQLKKDQVIKGEVKKLTTYGVFVLVRPKIQGLCHVSEFGSFKKMQEVLEVGKKYNFKITTLEPKEYKIGLSFAAKDQSAP